MALSQSTDRWGGKDLGGMRCPLDVASCRGGHGGLGGLGGHGGPPGGLGGHPGGLGGQCHGEYGGLGGGELVAAEPMELKDTLLSDTVLSCDSENKLGGKTVDKNIWFVFQF